MKFVDFVDITCISIITDFHSKYMLDFSYKNENHGSHGLYDIGNVNLVITFL
jgi:hypothetical protein